MACGRRPRPGRENQEIALPLVYPIAYATSLAHVANQRRGRVFVR